MMKPISELLTIHPDYVSGNVLFRGTRTPVKILFDYLKSGSTIDDFLENHSSVERTQVIELLDLLQFFLTFKEEPTYEEAAARREYYQKASEPPAPLRSEDAPPDELAR